MQTVANQTETEGRLQKLGADWKRRGRTRAGAMHRFSTPLGLPEVLLGAEISAQSRPVSSRRAVRRHDRTRPGLPLFGFFPVEVRGERPTGGTRGVRRRCVAFRYADQIRSPKKRAKKRGRFDVDRNPYELI